MAYRGQGGLRPNSQCTKREPPNVSSWHTASIRCGAKVRTRSERSGHAESVGKRVDSTKMIPSGRARAARHPPDPTAIAYLLRRGERLILEVRMSSLDHACDGSLSK